ncbi:Alginate biosynthesis protein AlgA [compost metagenome]
MIGEGQLSSDSLHSHLINELMYPIHVIGLSNIIVAASPDGILVAHKDKSNQIKSVLKDMQTPMYEEKRWGRYSVLDYSAAGAEKETLTKKVELVSGKNISYHMHRNRKKIWTILSGEGVFLLDGVYYSIQAGDVLQIPMGAKHAMKANMPLEFIEIQIGSRLMEDDVIRTAVTWEDTMTHWKISGE